MPIEQVKLEIKKLKCPVPETLKITRGHIGLFRGRHCRVEIWTSKPKPLCLIRKVNGKPVRTFFGLNEITLANDTARHHEAHANANGAAFGTLSADEMAAITKWRNFVFNATKAGKPPAPLSEIVETFIDRETHKDETPFFETAMLDFLEMKEKDGSTKLDYRDRLKSYLQQLAKHLNGTRLGDISEEKFLAVLSETCKARDGISPAAPKTLNHWITAAKELFNWYYKRENKRRARAGMPALDNPLELIAKKKIRKTSEPETLPVPVARALLADLLANAPHAVPAVAVQMFCGIRNAEALRLRWRDVREKEVFLSLSITKTSETRSVPISENLRAWLNAAAVATKSAPAPESLVFAGKDTPAAALAKLSVSAREQTEKSDFESRKSVLTRIIQNAAARIGIAKPKNAFRHTAVSAVCKIYGFERAADYCGHDIRTQGKHYRAAISEQDAKDYFGIMPPTGDGKAIAFCRSRAKSATGTPPNAKDDSDTARELPAPENEAATL